MDILLAEDDLTLCGALSQTLARRGFRVSCCTDGQEALALALRHHLDAIVLDLTIPGLDGVEVIQRLRDSSTFTPVMVITGRDAVADRVVGFDIGADDYMPKPFDVLELEARLRALIRRSRGEEELRCGALHLDRASGIFFNKLRPLDLSPREASLLTILLKRRGRAVTKEVLHEAVVGAEAQTSLDAVDLLIHQLRRRIVGAAAEVIALRGIGYVLVDEAASAQGS